MKFSDRSILQKGNLTHYPDMNKKDLIFTIGLTIFMGVLWMVGFLVMGIWIPVKPQTHLRWLIFIVVTTLVISIWHAMIEDKSGEKDPKAAKYERKTSKKNNKKKHRK